MKNKQETIEKIADCDRQLNSSYVSFLSLPDKAYWLRLMDAILDHRLALMILLSIQMELEKSRNFAHEGKKTSPETMKREIIEYIETVDACDDSLEKGRLTDCEILQQTAYVYLSTGQIFECLKWSVCGKVGSLFRSALRTITRR